MEDKKCHECKYATQIDEHEWECSAEEYDIDSKNCFLKRD